MFLLVYMTNGCEGSLDKTVGSYKARTTLLTCRLLCLSSVQEESFLSEEPDMPLRRCVSKVRHMTGSGWALARLSVDLWVTSHSNREPSSYPANRSGPGPESGCKRGRMIREGRRDAERQEERTLRGV